MRIGFDGKRAMRNYTGLGNYSRSTIKLLAEEFPEHQLLIYADKPRKHPRLAFINQLQNIEVKTPLKSIFRLFWRSWGITRQLKADQLDIYHGLSHELPFSIRQSGIKTVVTVHDLIFLRFPRYYPWIDQCIYRIKFSFACRHADRIIAISQQTKRDIIHFFHIPEAKIDVVYQGCDDAFTIPVAEERRLFIAEKYQLPKHFILSVGTIEERKNLLLSLKALTKLPEEICLVAIGRKTAYQQELEHYIQQHQLEARVFFLENIAFDDLPGIYQSSQTLVYPSRFEGFGIPILEALNSKIPVIAATGSCLEEAGGPSSIYIHPDDETALANAIDEVINNSTLRTNMIENGLSYAQRFSHQEIARNLMRTYVSL